MHDNPICAAVSARSVENPGSTEYPCVIVVDDDAIVSLAIVSMVEDAGFCARRFGSAEALLGADRIEHAACVLLDERLPGMSGLEALRRLTAQGFRVPVIMITGAGDVATAVAAMKAGARDFIEKPATELDILAAIDAALDDSGPGPALDQLSAEAVAFIAMLTPRQRQIVEMVVAGYSNKIIASDLGISQRTVEGHRHTIMQKSGVKSLPALTRMMFASSLVPRHPVLAPHLTGRHPTSARADLGA